MHARTEQLLAKRDGEPLEADVAAHIDSCAECRDSLARLETMRAELRALPELSPPADMWSDISRRVAERPGRHRPALAAAAIVAVTMAVAIFAMRGPAPLPQAPEVAVVVPETTASREDDLVLLSNRSALMERELQRLRRNAPAVVRMGHQFGRARVESRLSALEYGLSRADANGVDDAVKRAYWNERVRLLDSMLQMEQAEMINRDLAAYRVVPVRHSE